MRVQLDRSKCVGHAQCYSVAPNLFPIDDAGYCVLEAHTVDRDSEDLARDGVAACPEGALTLDQLGDEPPG